MADNESRSRIYDGIVIVLLIVILGWLWNITSDKKSIGELKKALAAHLLNTKDNNDIIVDWLTELAQLNPEDGPITVVLSPEMEQFKVSLEQLEKQSKYANVSLEHLEKQSKHMSVSLEQLVRQSETGVFYSSREEVQKKLEFIKKWREELHSYLEKQGRTNRHEEAEETTDSQL